VAFAQGIDAAIVTLSRSDIFAAKFQFEKATLSQANHVLMNLGKL
jgi:hypothetical protein